MSTYTPTRPIYYKDEDGGRALWLPGRLGEDFERKDFEMIRQIWTPPVVREPSLLAKLLDRLLGEPEPVNAATAAAYVCTPAPFAAGTAIHTFITAIAPAGHGLSMTEFSISFDGVTASAVPVLVTINHSTQATAGTAGVSTVITQVRGRVTSGSAPTMGGNYTAQNTALTILKPWYVPAFMGCFVYQSPLGREVECDSSGGTIKAISLVTTPAAAVNCTGYMEVEALG